MISTVTTSTVSAIAITSSLVAIGILVLLLLLIQKELVSSSNNSRAKRYRKVLNIAIYPLLIGFVLVVISKVGEVLK